MWFEFALSDDYYSAHRPDDNGWAAYYRNRSHDHGSWPDYDYGRRHWGRRYWRGAYGRDRNADVNIETHLGAG